MDFNYYTSEPQPNPRHPINIASLLANHSSSQQNLSSFIPLDFQNDINFLTNLALSYSPNYCNTNPLKPTSLKPIPLSGFINNSHSLVGPIAEYNEFGCSDRNLNTTLASLDQLALIPVIVPNSGPVAQLMETFPKPEAQFQEGSPLESVFSPTRSSISSVGMTLEPSISPFQPRPISAPKPTPLQAIRSLPTPSVPLKKKNMARDHLDALCQIYSISSYLDPTETEALAAKLGLRVRQVRNWFYQARAQERETGRKPNERKVAKGHQLLTDEQVVELMSELDILTEFRKRRIEELAERLGLPVKQIEEWMKKEMIRRKN